MTKKYHKNPRKISKRKLEQLEQKLAEYGDLGGIVHDLNSNEIVSGNQRDTVIDIDSCDIEIVSQFDEPDYQGTIAHGFVLWNGARYNYRQVRWTPEQCEEANILANLAGGDWDFEILSSDWSTQKIVEFGMDSDTYRSWWNNFSALGTILDGDNENSEWDGMPEYDIENKESYQSIHIHFKSKDGIDISRETNNYGMRLVNINEEN